MKNFDQKYEFLESTCYPTPRIALFVRPLVTKFQPSGVLDAPGVLDAAWAPKGREGRSQAGQKAHKLEVGARRSP